MKNFISLLFALIAIHPNAFCQVQLTGDEKIVERIADNIIEKTCYGFKYQGQALSTLTPADYKPGLRLCSPYTDWKYWNGVLNIGLLEWGAYTGNPKYKETVKKNYAFAFDHFDFVAKNFPNNGDRWDIPLGLMANTAELDDCGAMGAGLIEIYKENPEKRYKAYLDHAADHTLNKQHRLEDGTLVRTFPFEMTLWADDLYMSIVFLARMGELTGDQRYFNDAVQQVINFTKHLYHPAKGIYYHCWYSDLQRNGVAFWGRCNGWVMVAQAELLARLPDDHPKRSQLLEILEQHIVGISRYQTASGLWRQLLDKDDSYLETSATAMFTYTVAKAVNEKWIDKRYQSIAEYGWQGIKQKITVEGLVQDICAGTGIRENLTYYYNRPPVLNDIHGLGAVLLAGIEVLKLPEDWERN